MLASRLTHLFAPRACKLTFAQVVLQLLTIGLPPGGVGVETQPSVTER